MQIKVAYIWHSPDPHNGEALYVYNVEFQFCILHYFVIKITKREVFKYQYQTVQNLNF